MKECSVNQSVNSSPQPDSKTVLKMRNALEKQKMQREMSRELADLAEIAPQGRRYSHRMQIISLRIFLASSTAYLIISQFFAFPCIRTMYSDQKRLLESVHNKLTQIKECQLIAREFTKNWPKNTKIILGVDACSVNPYVALFKNRTVKGLIDDDPISKNMINENEITISIFEEWLKKQETKIIDSLFLFNVQPLNPNLKSFIIHIFPTKSGKANSIIMDILLELSKELKKLEIETISFAADGDTFFSQMHETNIANHIFHNNYVIKSVLQKTLMISDPLHVLKRVRYHLIPEIEDKSQLLKILNLPSMVFRNDRASKMHDKLPLLLLQIENYELLCQSKQFNYSFYILPYALLLTSLSRQMEYSERLYLLHMSRSILHRMHFSDHNIIKKQIQMKPNIIRDALSTLISICDILHLNSIEMIHMNRLGTNPIEHDFAVIRLRSKDHNRAQRFINEAAKINALQKLREEMIEETINHRDLQFGRIVEAHPYKIDFMLVEKMVNSLINEASNGICDINCQKAHQLFQKVIKNKNIENKKCYLFNSDQVLLAPNSNIKIEKRQDAANLQHKKCRWTADEVDLLMKLNKDLNGKIEMIINYFPKRTTESITKKMKEIKNIKEKK
ncbi:hypothetical protein M9Y10_002295 [Tritrichomonas musculus]|uniref:Myb-like domain-containing protein n=1 Tax=Tritrichomonas musculus TaxID=1915356 RepID=A0ABR2LB28_9EUKA